MDHYIMQCWNSRVQPDDTVYIVGDICYHMEILDEKLFPKGRIPMTREQELNMERCAEFMARMIMKYGDKILADIEAEKGWGSSR